MKKSWLLTLSFAVISVTAYGGRVPIAYYAPVPPPPCRWEVRPVSPGPGFVWIDGFWGYEERHLAGGPLGKASARKRPLRRPAMGIERAINTLSARVIGKAESRGSAESVSRGAIPAMDKKSLALALLTGAATLHAATKIVSGDFGKTREGALVRIFTLTNKSGVETTITNYGGRVVTLKVPDKRGAMGDVVLGFDSLEGYLNENPYFGAIIGRYANRIGRAQFTLDGVLYKVAKNAGENSLHGGLRGFDKVVWNARALPDGGLELTYLSKDGDQGYPGNCKVTVVYHLTDLNELKIEYTASTDKDTVVNLTNHAYFNFKGSGDILDHIATLNADRSPIDGGF